MYLNVLIFLTVASGLTLKRSAMGETVRSSHRKNGDELSLTIDKPQSLHQRDVGSFTLDRWVKGVCMWKKDVLKEMQVS